MTYKKMIETLQRRADYLTARIVGADKDLSYDKQELSALTKAIGLLNGIASSFREEQQDEYHHRSFRKITT